MSAARVRVVVLSMCMVVGVATGCTLNPNSIASQIHSSGPGVGISVMFTNVNNVPAGAPVTYNGTRVGRVESVRLEAGEVRVDAKVDPGLWFADDVRAVVRQDTVLGDPYIALEGEPTSEIMRVAGGGLVIPTTRTTAPPPLENTLSVVSTFVNGGSIQDMQSTIRSVNNTFPDLEQTVGVSRIVAIDTRDLARNTDRLDRMLAGMDATARAIIPNLGKLERMLSPDGRPEGVYYWRQLMDVMKEVGVLLPSVGSVYQGGMWLLPLLQDVNGSIDVITEGSAAVSQNSDKLNAFLSDTLFPFIDRPGARIVSVTSPQGKELLDDVHRLLRMLGATR
ncbi:MCE family protein [Gordonia sp. zg691]|uniref:MCE family protein n=1 Tax=Gordonia jinghuaiqii TaxID=2758710 RepID=A0A7D7LSS9_9ACTN|nr:MlaD family protein [Gordonia jinghuaiqii]MBD0863511.1 MCE family protein [Gordonia jinghuaiqii]QMT01037.1 MCE family protein [Gordonia jinghuaiqii]